MNVAQPARLAAIIVASVACGCTETNSYYMPPTTGSESGGSESWTSSGGRTTGEPPTGGRTTDELTTTVGPTTGEPTTIGSATVEPTTGETTTGAMTSGSSDSDSTGSSTGDPGFCGDGVVDEDEECDDVDDLVCTDFCVDAPFGPFSEEVDSTPPIGIVKGPYLDGECDGALFGVLGSFEMVPQEITRLKTVCADVLFEPGLPGEYRMVPDMENPNYGKFIGEEADFPVLLELLCPSSTPFLTGIGGYGKVSGISTLILECADFHVVYSEDEDEYLTIFEDYSYVSAGNEQGEEYMFQSCLDLDADVASEMSFTETNDRISSISLDCAVFYYE